MRRHGSPSATPPHKPPTTASPLPGRRTRRLLAALVALFVTAPLAAAPGLTASGSGDLHAASAADGQRWYLEVEPALAEAERSGRLVMVDLYAEWCGWCKQLDKEFQTDHFQAWAEDFVLLRVDVEDGGEGTELQKHLEVRALPTTALMDHDKVRVGLLQGFKPAPQLTRGLDQKVAEYRRLRGELDAQGESADRGERLAAADKLRSLHAGRAAAQIYRSVLADEGLGTAERARVGAALTDAWLMAGELDAARGSLTDARTAVAASDEESRFRTQRLLDNLSLRITQEREGCDQVAELESFLAERPRSTYVAQVQRRLDDLKTEASNCS